jgi:hypothetical protein
VVTESAAENAADSFPVASFVSLFEDGAEVTGNSAGETFSLRSGSEGAVEVADGIVASDSKGAADSSLLVRLRLGPRPALRFAVGRVRWNDGRRKEPARFAGAVAAEATGAAEDGTAEVLPEATDTGVVDPANPLESFETDAGDSVDPRVRGANPRRTAPNLRVVEVADDGVEVETGGAEVEDCSDGEDENELDSS